MDSVNEKESRVPVPEVLSVKRAGVGTGYAPQEVSSPTFSGFSFCNNQYKGDEIDV